MVFFYSTEAPVHNFCHEGPWISHLHQVEQYPPEISQTRGPVLPLHCKDDGGAGTGLHEGSVGRGGRKWGSSGLLHPPASPSTPAPLAHISEDTVHRACGEVSILEDR